MLVLFKLELNNGSEKTKVYDINLLINLLSATLLINLLSARVFVQ